MTSKTFNIAPSPSVLLALTNTPLKPIDALCELIDNALDSFNAARLMGSEVKGAFVQVHVPGAAEVGRGEGRVVVIDNGIGLSADGLRSALTAGYSSKNQFDTLGLFGMGFNIATGKLGTRTEIITCRLEDEFAIRTVLDLPTLVKQQTFDLEFEYVDKPGDMLSGTKVSVSGWWPQGNANADFVKKLAAVPKSQLAAQLGRRYATILRRDDAVRIQMFVNSDVVRGFEHCVWGETRFVERQGWGRIHARIEIDQIIHSSRHCIQDKTILGPSDSRCPACDGVTFRTVDERVRGWVGIQRYDDTDAFGIDLIRNGRAIRVAEKEAFFSWENASGIRAREYPIDSQYGRIVGEIHLDHVSVDYTKQDFARASEEWARAIELIRGESLLEMNWPENYKNQSPIGMLFKGYRKVRSPGLDDMYMGYFDETQNKPVRIKRAVEEEFLEKFLAKEPGYYDDAEWWKKVEEASHPVLKGVTPCPNCEYQNRDDSDRCTDCNYVLRPKECLNCGHIIGLAEVTCETCGASQLPEVSEPWVCAVCETINSEEDDHCDQCQSLRGTLSRTDVTELLRVSRREGELSFGDRVFALGFGISASPLSAEVYFVPAGQLIVKYGEPPVPMVTHHLPGKLRFFIDETSSIFQGETEKIRSAISLEVASYLMRLHSEVNSKPGFSLSLLVSKISRDLWPEVSTDNLDLSSEIENFFSRAAELLGAAPETRDFYQELSLDEQSFMSQKLISRAELDRLGLYSQNGQYLKYVPAYAMARYHALSPGIWKTEVWQEGIVDVSNLDSDNQNLLIRLFTRRVQLALEVCAEYVTTPSNQKEHAAYVRRALTYLNSLVR